MTEAQLVSAVGALFSGRFYPDLNDAAAVELPYATWQQVGGRAITFFEGAATDDKNARIQINVWATTRAEANSLIRQIENLVVQTPLFGIAEGAAIAQYDDVTNYRGMHQDFSFWLT